MRSAWHTGSSRILSPCERERIDELDAFYMPSFYDAFVHISGHASDICTDIGMHTFGHGACENIWHIEHGDALYKFLSASACS